MESIKAICTPDYVLVFNPEDGTVMPFVELLIKALKPTAPALFPPRPEKRVRPRSMICNVVMSFVCTTGFCALTGSIYTWGCSTNPCRCVPHQKCPLSFLLCCMWVNESMYFAQARSTSVSNLHGLDRESTHSTGSMGADSTASGLLPHTVMQHGAHAGTYQGTFRVVYLSVRVESAARNRTHTLYLCTGVLHSKLLYITKATFARVRVCVDSMCVCVDGMCLCVC